MRLRNLQNRSGLRFAWVEDRCGAHVKWKHQSVAKTISVKELGRGEGYIAGPDVQYAAGVILAAVNPVVVKVNGGFRPARAAGCPEPEGGGVPARGRSLQAGR